MQQHIRRLHNPVYLISFFILVAFLSSAFAWLGTEGITFVVLGSAAIVVASPVLFGMLRQQWTKMLSGKPSKLDFVVAPSGYRRARYTETEQEAIAQSVVIPTPNRPLVLEVPTTPAISQNVLAQHDLRQQQKKQSAVALIETQNVGPVLKLSPDCTPRIDDVLGHAIFGVGMRGSGKSNLAAVLIEEIGQHHIPMLICDPEEEYVTLPSVLQKRCVIGGPSTWGEKWRYQDLYWEITPENAEEVGYLILDEGWQVVLQIGAYETRELAASIMVDVIKGMFTWAEDHDPSKRVPCLIFLDEAQYFLPQNESVSPIAKEEANSLLKIFMDVNARGRKRGLTPAIFTQRIAQVRKEVIAGSEIYFLGRQTMDNDVNRYIDIVGKGKLDPSVVQTLPQGDFVVFEGGEVFITHMNERKSEHRSNTPKHAQAMERYGNRPAATQKFRSVQTTLLDEEIDTEHGYEDIEEDGYPFSSTNRDSDIYESKTFRQPETPQSLIPIIPDKSPKAEDIDLHAATLLWNGGFNSEDKLRKAIPRLNKYQAALLRDRILAQTSVHVEAE